MEGRGPAPFGGGGYCPGGGACIYACGAEDALSIQEFKNRNLGTYVASDPSAVMRTWPLRGKISERRRKNQISSHRSVVAYLGDRA